MKYVLEQSNEFIDSYKYLQLATAEKKMEALCDNNYNRLFSIGDDGKFYLTYEKSDNDTGWEKVNLNEFIEKSNPHKTISTKTFAIAQDSQNEKFYLSVVVTIDNVDRLYVSKEEIIYAPKWIEVPFDDSSITSNIAINELYMSTLNSKRYIIADITTNDASKILKRYFINIDSTDDSNKWISHSLPGDFQHIYTSSMGRSYKEAVDGIYTIGSIGGVKQLIYTPSYNYFNPNLAPNSIRLALDNNVNFISAIREESTGYTHLFSCGGNALYIYPYKEQKGNAKAYKILEDENLNNIKNLYSYEIDGKKMVWILNQNGDLFYCFSTANDSALTDADNWSSLVPILTNIKYAYAYPNIKNGVSNYFAYGYDSIINVGKESAITSLWTNQKINLTSLNGPSTKFPSYCTRIEVKNENKVPVAKKKVILTATDYCNVYINNRYYSFKDDPISVFTDERGLVKIVQQADSTVSANFNVTINDRDNHSISIDINPQNKQLDKLTSLNTVDKLKGAKNGIGEILVPDGVKDKNIEAVANSMDIFKDMATSLPQDGTVMKEGLLKGVNYLGTSHKGIFVIRVNGDKVRSFSGDEALINLPPKYLNLMTAKGGVVDDIIYNCGEVLNFIKNIPKKVFDIVIHFVNDTWNFILTIGDKIYSFAVKCINEVVACVQAVYNLIKVTIKKIFDYIKFLFAWEDISRVKDVMKKTVFLSVKYLNDNLKTINIEVNDAIEKMVDKISQMADLDVDTELSKKKITDMQNAYIPKENTNVTDMYLTDYFIENYSSSELEENLKSTLSMDDDLKKAFSILCDAALKEKSVITELINDLNDNLFKDSKFLEYDFLTILKKLVAIIAKSTLSSCGNVLTAATDFFELLSTRGLEIMAKPIVIPVLSDILTDIFGIKPFSTLDIICLLPSIGTTFIYKLATNESPFDDESYDIFMSIESFDDLKKVKQLNTSASDSTTEINKILYCVYHIFAGCIGTIETACQGVELLAKEGIIEPIKNKFFIGITLILNILDVVIMGVGLKIFCPIKDEGVAYSVTLAISIILVVVKSAIDFGDITFKFKKFGDNKVLKEIYNVIKAIATLIEGMCQIGLIIYYLIKRVGKEINDDSAGLLISNCCSIILCDIKTIMDISYDYAKDVYLKGGIEAIRVICAVGYSSVQIALGINGAHVIDVESKSRKFPKFVNLIPDFSL
ncbi:hypothetical protein SAMN02745163_00661 [Clostridium cavendishii DSM 21758]|uniref:Uncharacterized protein n=1 Tax=Clostridium cavendishii DSM 21758 TaxID=1121302 RepID=A0A1M6D8P3_9CLOT|nr:hypothetical protein [Clostridium cavendishii]SHI69539.1 hypothetical protein SAMN02745163_00661 [Clostridium cavendishii DSM 21758]